MFNVFENCMKFKKNFFFLLFLENYIKYCIKKN